MTHDHGNVTGDARKRLEAEQDERDQASLQRHMVGHPSTCTCSAHAELSHPFDVHPACRQPWEGRECGRRDSHTHWSPVMAEYSGFDPT